MKMKRSVSIVAIVLTSCAFLFGQTTFKTYTNQRFFFTIQYPSSFIMGPSEFTGDGRIFKSQDGTAEMRAWANYNALSLSVQQQFAEDLKDFNGQIKYKMIRENRFVISGVSKDKIFYRRTVYHKFKDTDVFYTFTIEYPKFRKTEFDPIIRRIAKSFHFDPRADV